MDPTEWKANARGSAWMGRKEKRLNRVSLRVYSAAAAVLGHHRSSFTKRRRLQLGGSLSEFMRELGSRPLAPARESGETQSACGDKFGGGSQRVSVFRRALKGRSTGS